MFLVSSANALVQLLTIPPYVVAAIIMLSLSYASDKSQSRGFFYVSDVLLVELVVCMFVQVLSFFFFRLKLICDSLRLLLVVANNKHVPYFATFCVVSGTYTTIGLIIAWCRFFLHFIFA